MCENEECRLGKRELKDESFLPRQIPIRILVTSADVLHALFDSSLFTFFEREYNTVTG